MPTEINSKKLIPLTNEIVESNLGKLLYMYNSTTQKEKEYIIIKKLDGYYAHTINGDIWVGEKNIIDEKKTKHFYLCQLMQRE